MNKDHDIIVVTDSWSPQQLQPTKLIPKNPVKWAGEQEKECILILHKMPLQFIAKDQL
jgi:hypothetical protein